MMKPRYCSVHGSITKHRQVMSGGVLVIQCQQDDCHAERQPRRTEYWGPDQQDLIHAIFEGLKKIASKGKAKMKTLPIVVLLIAIGYASNASAGIRSLAGDTLSPIRPIEEVFQGIPSLLDMIKEQENIAWMNDLYFEKSFAGGWKRAGCTVEDRSEPLARVICPGFRIDPKKENEDGAAQWFISELQSEPATQASDGTAQKPYPADPHLIGGI